MSGDNIVKKKKKKLFFLLSLEPGQQEKLSCLQAKGFAL